MAQIQYGFTMPQISPDKAGQVPFVEHLDRALRLIGGRFELARMIDHLIC